MKKVIIRNHKYFPWQLLSTILLVGMLQCLSSRSFCQTDQEVVEQIAEKLQRAVGDFREDWPEIVILDKGGHMASYVSRGEQNWIYIDRKALEACRRLGRHFENGLAFLIGHELAHFYQEYDWSEAYFSNHFRSVPVAAIEKKLEMEADLYGSFLAKQAGYEIDKIAEPLLRILYQTYQQTVNETALYPALEERIELAANSCITAHDYHNAFHTANYLLVAGQPQLALMIYNFINEKIKSYELHLTIATASNDVLLKKDPLPLKYPLQISSDIPITRDQNIFLIPKLLEMALENSEKALLFDAHSIPAQLNRLLALELRGDPHSAENHLSELYRLKSLNEWEEDQLTLVSANLKARNGAAEEALNRLAKVDPKHPNLYRKAQFNVNVLKGENGESIPSLVKETLDQSGMNQLRAFKKKLPTLILPRRYQLDIEELSGTVLCRLSGKKVDAKVQRFYDPNIEREGVKVGKTKSELTKFLPARYIQTLETESGEYIFNPKYNLILKFDRDDRLIEWGRVIIRVE